jgi:hypothetical protein
MRVGVMRRGLAVVVVAVLSIVVVTSTLTRKMAVTDGQSGSYGLHVAHPEQMKSIPANLIPLP